MSRCATTRSLLDARFAEIDLARDQAAHVAACAECARAFALLRRFDADLESVGRDLAPERMGSVHDLIRVSVPEEGSIVSWRNGFIGVAAVAVVLLAVTVVGDRSLGSDVGRIFGLALDRSEAARAFGIPDDAVVMVGSDAVGLRVQDRGDAASLELLIMEADDRRVRQVYEAGIHIPPGSGGLFTEAVRCFGAVERDIYAVVAMGWPAPRAQAHAVVGGINGELAEFETPGGRDGALFVADADEVDDDATVRVRIGGGESTSSLGHLRVDCAQPATARCGDWEQWEAGTRASMTQWLTETRLDAVRAAQQLRDDASEVEIVTAAVSSIDKNCQMSPAERRLTDVVERLYD